MPNPIFLPIPKIPDWLISLLVWAATKAREGGIKFVITTTITVTAAGITVAVVALPEAGVDTTPTASDAPIVPATGVEGFKVAEFCNDPLTKVRVTPSPDAGFTYQLTRLKDGVSETVTFCS